MRVLNFFIAAVSSLLGFFSIYFLLLYSVSSHTKPAAVIKNVSSKVGIQHREVIGFLPYWLIDKADKDYSPYITTLTYFGLTVGPDGAIQKYIKPGEKEPGWYALESGSDKKQYAIITSRI